MRTPLILLALVMAIPFSSCKKEKNDNDGGYTVPDLTFSFDVSGDIVRSENFSSPENNNTQGGHGHGVISTHSSALNAFTITGQGPDYSFSINAEMPSVTTGTPSVQVASFTDISGGSTSSFGTIQSSSLNITSAVLNYQAGVATFYTVAGNFSFTLTNSVTPPESVTFSGSFSGLHVTAS